MNDVFFETCGYRVLCALRRIIRAVDIYSRKLNTDFNITTPQMLCLYSLAKKDGIMPSELAREVTLSGSTVNGIIDRLEAKGLVTRTRSTEDRRKVLVGITQEGLLVTEKAPSLLQDRLSEALRGLSELEQMTIAMSLERVVAMMEVENLDASPNLMLSAQLGPEETQA